MARLRTAVKTKDNDKELVDAMQETTQLPDLLGSELEEQEEGNAGNDGKMEYELIVEDSQDEEEDDDGSEDVRVEVEVEDDPVYEMEPPASPELHRERNPSDEETAEEEEDDDDEEEDDRRKKKSAQKKRRRSSLKPPAAAKKKLFVDDEHGQPIYFAFASVRRRETLIKLIENNGGRVLRLGHSAPEGFVVIYLQDVNAKPALFAEELPADIYESTYVDDCLQQDTLLPLQEYLLDNREQYAAEEQQPLSEDAAQERPRSALSHTSQQGQQRASIGGGGRKLGRHPYLPHEDHLLFQLAMEQIQQGAKPSGNLIYKSIEPQFFTHTWQSLRERFVKKLLPLTDRYSVEQVLSHLKNKADDHGQEVVTESPVAAASTATAGATAAPSPSRSQMASPQQSSARKRRLEKEEEVIGAFAASHSHSKRIRAQDQVPKSPLAQEATGIMDDGEFPVPTVPPVVRKRLEYATPRPVLQAISQSEIVDRQYRSPAAPQRGMYTSPLQPQQRPSFVPAQPYRSPIVGGRMELQSPERVPTVPEEERGGSDAFLSQASVLATETGTSIREVVQALYLTTGDWEASRRYLLSGQNTETSRPDIFTSRDDWLIYKEVIAKRTQGRGNDATAPVTSVTMPSYFARKSLVAGDALERRYHDLEGMKRIRGREVVEARVEFLKECETFKEMRVYGGW